VNELLAFFEKYLSVSALIVAVIGIAVPVVFSLFVISLTRRGREFSRLEGFFDSIDRLHNTLHSVFLEKQK
jgi:hypothetical protein